MLLTNYVPQITPKVSQLAAELHSIQDLMRWAVSQFNQANLFYGHGTSNAYDEAYFLLSEIIHLPSLSLEDYAGARLTQTEKESVISAFLARVDTRKPAAYLLNKAYFAGLEFKITEDVLIPRSPTAELINNELGGLIDPDSVERVLDCCTGSGCIAIAMAYAFPEASIDATDISPAALKVAHENIEYHQLQDQIRLIESDCLGALSEERYDVIIANPPYVNEAEYADLPAEYQHEPKLGLTANDHGLSITTTILRQARQYLDADGLLIVEVGYSEDALIDKFPEVPFLWCEFDHGGSGVFVLTKEQLDEFSSLFDDADNSV